MSEVKKQKSKIKIEKLFTWLAFLVSVCTLYLFFYQTSLMKKQQYASVLPFLSVGNTEKGGNYSFLLTNDGIGPAFINEMNIHYKDSVYKNIDVNTFFLNVIREKDTLFKTSQDIIHSTVRKGMLIPDGQTIQMLSLIKKAENFEIKQQQLRTWLNSKIKVEIIYESVYKEKWRMIYPSEDAPQKID